MPEPLSATPRLYTIPPSAPFLTILARALLHGDLPIAGGLQPDPLSLPLTTIYLPTRRAARGLREAFLSESASNALLLPRIRTLGDPDEDAALVFGAGTEADDGAGAAAIGPLPRRFALMRLILAWGSALRRDAIADPTDMLPILGGTPAQASHLAADLARLMDFIENEEVTLDALENIVPEVHAAHWEITADFLKIVTQHWPDYLADNGLVSPVARRNALMHEETDRLAVNPQAYPVIAAGSTGTVPATARLLEVIASLPLGAVVLPGLDLDLNPESWASLPKHPEHPQAGMAELLRRLGVERSSVAYVAGSAPDAMQRARLHLVSEALRPAESTDLWQNFLNDDELSPQGRASLANAVSGLQSFAAPTAHDEAEAIALILKSSSDIPGKTAALITPDRVLARRVAARLKGFNLTIDDSAGVPLTRTAPGAFLDLILGVMESNFGPAQLMALLKHPLTLVGRRPGEIRKAARAVERGAFRNVYVGQGLEGVASALKAARDEDKHRRIGEEAQADALKLVGDLETAFAPLTSLVAGRGLLSATEIANAHSAVADALAQDANASASGLWQGEAGEALSVLMAELIAKGGALALSAGDYPSFYRSLLAGHVVRPRAAALPRLFIWGPLEARLQQPDIVILGGLNEGVWPRPQEADPWLSRPMREALGLPPPEWRMGLAAHDFAQGLGAQAVYLTRALKVDGVETVPSRWLQRLLALVNAAGLQEKIAPKEPWLAWARERDRVDQFAPVSAPKPCPPVESRPRHLSVTRIERWLANPYEIFARDILKLYPFEALGAEPDQSLRGQIVHGALHDFAVQYPDTLPDDILGALVPIADRRFANLGGSPRVEAFWRPHFQRFARWFAATEPARRTGNLRTETEVEGALDLGLDVEFRLTARADRIDVTEDGSVRIYDYKTGSVPGPKQVGELFAPQLPLEAAIALGGGFGELRPHNVESLRYIRATGRYTGGEEQDAAPASPELLAAAARVALEALVTHFSHADTPYEVKRRPGAAFQKLYRYDDYEQLARVKEWLTADAEEDFR